MDTHEAREVMRDLGCRGLEVVRGYMNGECSAGDAARRVRESIVEARAVLADAGYPAEAVWRSLQWASAMFAGVPGQYDAASWIDLSEELREAIESLDTLLTQPGGPGADFRIIG